MEAQCTDELVRITPDDDSWTDAPTRYASKDAFCAGWFLIEDADGNSVGYFHREEIKLLAEYAGFIVTEAINEQATD